MTFIITKIYHDDLDVVDSVSISLFLICCSLLRPILKITGLFVLDCFIFLFVSFNYDEGAISNDPGGLHNSISSRDQMKNHRNKHLPLEIAKLLCLLKLHFPYALREPLKCPWGREISLCLHCNSFIF